MDIFDSIYTELNTKGGLARTVFYVLVGVGIGLFLGATIIRFVFGVGG